MFIFISDKNSHISLLSPSSFAKCTHTPQTNKQTNKNRKAVFRLIRDSFVAKKHKKSVERTGNEHCIDWNENALQQNVLHIWVNVLRTRARALSRNVSAVYFWDGAIFGKKVMMAIKIKAFINSFQKHKNAPNKIERQVSQRISAHLFFYHDNKWHGLFKRFQQITNWLFCFIWQRDTKEKLRFSHFDSYVFNRGGASTDARVRIHIDKRPKIARFKSINQRWLRESIAFLL